MQVLISHLLGVVVGHAGGVIDGQHDLVLALAGLGAAQPDLVLAELGGNVGDHLAHVQTLPCAVVSPATKDGIVTTLLLLLFAFLPPVQLGRKGTGLVVLPVRLFSCTCINAFVVPHSRQLHHAECVCVGGGEVCEHYYVCLRVCA